MNDRYREAMHRLRGPVPPPREELPQDPDSDHVPPELQAADGQHVLVSGVDRASGKIVHERGALTTVPGLHGDLHRRGQD
jgi:hypothetical protein